MNRHLRKAVVVSAAVTAGLLMTACQNGSTNSGSSSNGSKSNGSSQHQSASKTSSQHSKTSASSGSSGSSGQQGSGTAAQNASSSKQGVNGAFTGGTVSYLAPGKYIVAAPGKADQIFFVADDTEVYGAGKICGNPRSEARPSCTLDQLETAAKKADVTADVTLKNGIATVVRERHDAETGTGGGVSATYDGTVSYLAPGKYTVAPSKGGAEQAFYVSNDTVVRGAGSICGSPMSQSMYTCTLDQLETASKKGVAAKVVIEDGVATSVTEDR